MPIFLRSLGRSSHAISTSFACTRRVPISSTVNLQRLQKQAISSLWLPGFASLRCQQQTRLSSSEQKAKDLNQRGIDNELSKLDDDIEAEKEKQVRAPWHREGADQAPVSRPRTASAMTKGRLFHQSCIACLTVARQASYHSIQANETGATIDNA